MTGAAAAGSLPPGTTREGTIAPEQDASGDAGFFGRPLFEDPGARALSRVGVVDVGSNSVRLVVFDGAARSPAYFYNEKVMAGLGAGLSETGRLNPEGRQRALAALRRFARLGENLGAGPLTVVATAAVREAEDGPDFRADVERETGLRLWVIDGQEEARLSAQGVLLGWPEAKGIVCDIGGSSMELAEVGDGRVGRRKTSPLGPLRLANVPGGKKGLAAHIRAGVAEIVEGFPSRPDRLFLVGGSWRAFARQDMERRGYPLHVLHEYRMSPADVRATRRWIAEGDLAELRARTGTSEARMSLLPIASLVLKELVRQLKPREVAVSSYGIREGMLYEQMPLTLRARDPLIEACRFAEVKDARIPGFGKVLFRFLQPIFRAVPARRQRMIKAACLLHDVTWRAHPDYRHEVCFDNATRANLGGLTHPERLYLGLSLLHRYKNSRSGTRFEPILELLAPELQAEAEVLGKAMRFGAMFSGADARTLGSLTWKPKKKVLGFRLSPETVDLMGEVAQARFDSLAAALGAEAQVRVG